MDASGHAGGTHTSTSSQGNQKVRKPRSDKGLIRLTDRDLLTLNWIGEQYAVRLDVLQRLLGRDTQQATKEPGSVTESTARRVVGRWKAEGLVESRKFFFGKPEWVWLTTAGLTQMNLPYRIWSPKVSTLNHFHSVNLVRMHIEASYEEPFTWQSERSLRRRYQNDRSRHISDAELHHSQGAIGIEVELTQKSQRRVIDIVRKLAHQYDQVWYFVNQATDPVVRTTVGRELDEHFHLYDMSSISTE